MSAIEKFREECLKRGPGGILGIRKSFQIIDRNDDRSLDFDEFLFGLQICKMDMKEEEKKALFDECDRDGSGTLVFDEFLEALRGPLSESRLKIIKLAFKKMDKTGDGVIGVDDLKGVYNVRCHKKFLNGEMTEQEIFKEFLKVFEARSDDKDQKITLDEWMDYYSGISASIDTDAGFDLMMRQSYKL